MTFARFEEQLGVMLKEQPQGTAADLTEWAAAYWDGCQVVGIARRHDGSKRLDEEFDLNEHWYLEHEGEALQWLVDPIYTRPPELIEWLGDSPPCESGE